jgi:dipeptidyl aminopeptidase/acylaminoacyl peptidase
VWALPASGAPGEPALSTKTAKFAFSRMVDGAVAFAEETFTDLNRVMVWYGGDPPQQVTTPALPEGWPDAPLPEVEVLHWEGPDGMPVEGILTLPQGGSVDVPVPLVVHVHGGPAGVFKRRHLAWPGRHCDTLALAEAGIAVLKVNPRGSSGYGRAFRFANYGDWGGGDFGDILTGVEMLISRGTVDPDRLGIMGWSYGGFMTSWVITQTDRFRAACVGAGVTNLMSFTGTSDIPGFLPDYFGGEHWDDIETYLSHSAMGHVKGVTTPTLVQHGDADARVPLGQGREFYNALKRQGVETQMVIYPRQGHGVDEPRLRLDMRARPVAWMRRWLLGEETPA